MDLSNRCVAVGAEVREDVRLGLVDRRIVQLRDDKPMRCVARWM